ncbi:IS66 family insertion sequence element accessory protein TnpB [Rhizobium hidalgonense]|uniref:IS66 family insertion sequence element accessory protein TnpB n=1 Tax=Rhizobium hidalgonense TaxID=1538159 RepID=UPI0019D4673E
MIGPSGNVRVYLACGVTDMRRGIDGLSALVETVIKEAPGSGAIFGFRGNALIGSSFYGGMAKGFGTRILSLADGERCRHIYEQEQRPASMPWQYCLARAVPASAR